VPPALPLPLQDSQITLLQLAERHQQPLPYANNDHRQRLQLAAVRKQVEAAQAQLAAADCGPPAAAAAAAAQQYHPTS
jgi:hypothetical protein